MKTKFDPEWYEFDKDSRYIYSDGIYLYAK